MLGDWTDGDIQTLNKLFGRLNTGIENHSPQLADAHASASCTGQGGQRMSSTTEAPALPEVGQPPRLSHRQIVTILSGLMCGMFLAALDQTIVGTSIVKIANDLHGFDLQAWATTAYLITSTIVTPIYGKLSDIYGRKPFYLAAITIFVVGSRPRRSRTSMYELAAFRAVQGLGAGGLMSLAMTILGDIVPPRERAKYQGYILAVFGLSTVLGPVLGGFFAGIDTLAGLHGWRWVFLINVPIGIVALFVVAKVLNVPHTPHKHKIDWWGALTLIVAVVPFLIVAEQGQKWGWGDGKAILCYVVGGVGVIAFIVIEKLMKDAALIPLRLFKNSTFTVAIIGGVIVGVAMFGAIIDDPAVHAGRAGLHADRVRLADAAADGGHHDQLDRVRPAHRRGPGATRSSRSSARS